MKRKKTAEQFSETFSTKDSEKIYPFCISLVSSSLKELENKWINKISNISISNKNIIKILFSLLNYQIILIQQISKYYNLYLYNSDEDNIKLIEQIININNELMNKKIEAIINNKSNTKMNNEQNNRDYIYKRNRNKAFRNVNCNCNEKKCKINKKKDRTKKEENRNSVILSHIKRGRGKSINKLNLNNIVINTHTTNYNYEKPPSKRNITEKNDIINLSPYQNKKNRDSIDSSRKEIIKINLAEKFAKNNENIEYATLSNISDQPKKAFQTNLCLNKSSFNFHTKKNIFTLPVEENPVRKVKNIILNAKNNSNSLFLKFENSRSNTNLINGQYSYNTKRSDCLSEEINIDSNILIEKRNSQILFFNKSSNNFNRTNDNNNYEIKKSMSNGNFYVKSIDNDNDINKRVIKVNNKERKCNQILKDGMKKIEKRLNSKEHKKGFYKTKSNDCFSLVKKMINKNNISKK